MSIVYILLAFIAIFVFVFVFSEFMLLVADKLEELLREML